jgi:hypothetical protein
MDAPAVHNCSSSVTKILHGAGFTGFANPVIPTLFSTELEKAGFESVDKEDIAHKFKP